MAKSGRNNNKKNQNQRAAAPKPEQKAEVTVKTVVESKTESEFEKNKEALLEKFIVDIDQLETEKINAERISEELSKQINDLSVRKEKLQRECDERESNYNKAVETIENAKAVVEAANKEAEESAKSIIEDAEEDARSIRDSAEQDRLTVIANASEEARKAWKEQIDNLQKQIKEISKRENDLNDAKIKLDKDRQDFDFEKEALDEMKSHVTKLKERYTASNPTRINELELELSDEKKKYEILLGKHDSLSEKYQSAQVLLDTIKTEVEDSNGGKKLASASEIVSEMNEFKDKYKKLASIYSKYPDDENISALEERAQKADKLDRENHALEQERNRYREEVAAARNVSKELEMAKQSVDATNALNEHLLHELESHKTALESRSGDTCPALSKVDTEVEEQDFKDEIAKRIQRPQITSLKEMVSHVRNYAGSRRKEEQLFYTENDIRAFLAGMAVSRLIILQGMSGTGKSSLPRIFSEAISGFNRLIPVESSWRDRNELLGYYNDFNKKFNAKSFTIELYRSSKDRCQVIPTFIVLDEMNLARIEYYFSDFLAILQEPDHDKWLIELVSSDMRTLPMELPDALKQKMKNNDPSIYAIWEKIEKSRLGDLKSEISDEAKTELTTYLAKLGELTGAKDLVDGRKIRATDNIWFIGTVNKDESTFEISDKVYDRAQVVSLNRKGKSEGKYQSTNQKFISVDGVKSLFDAAISSYKNKSEVEHRLEELDKVLMDLFEISFGNRIVTQTVDFAAVFTAAGGTLEDALDYQISTKILRKVISSDDGEAFLELLDATKDYPETHRLISKRVKDLR